MAKDVTWSTFVDQLLREADISTVAVRLGMRLVQRQSARPRTICPFHNDTRPSLNLFNKSRTSKKGSYYCFACHAHGDAIALIRQIRSVGFRDAVEWLANTLGKTLPRNTRPEADYSGRIPGLVLGLEIFARLKPDEAKLLAEFALLRGYTLDQFRGWRIGATLGDKIRSYIIAEQKQTKSLLRTEIDNLQEAGLLARQESENAQLPFDHAFDEQPRDFFRDRRIIFALFDERGEPSGFAGRAVDADARIKYLYSKGFERKRILYRLDHVNRAANLQIGKSKRVKPKEAGWQFDLYLVEGLLDALRLETLGLHACAVLGSQLTQEQAALISQLAENLEQAGGALNVHFYFDGDEAGRKGAAKSIPLLWSSFQKFDVAPVIDSVALDPKISDKDPDATFRTIEDSSKAQEMLNSSLVPAAQTLLADQLECSPRDLASSWPQRSPSVQQWALSSLTRKIPRSSWSLILRRFRPFATSLQELLSEKNSWQDSLLLFLEESSQNRTKQEFFEGALREASSDRRDDQALVLAHHLAMASRNQREFPTDDGSWTRLGAALDVVLLFYKEQLRGRRGELLEPLLAVHLPKASGGLRLKALPCPEDLTLQQYLLNELLRGRPESPHFERSIPAVRWSGGQHTTTGWLDESGSLDEDSETVSYAYQVDMEVLDGNLPPGTRALFRPFFECWKDYIRHFQKRLEQLDGEKLHVARLDIKSFYDRILRSVVNAKLWRSLQILSNTSADLSNLAPLLYSEDTNRSSAIVDWICNQSFNYTYRDPSSGKEKKPAYPDMGIPQGPDLSAYIANILLFDLDRRISKTIGPQGKSEGQNKRKAIYGRYVDDIVLISTTAEQLEDLENLVAFELANVGLSLNAKNEPLPPMTPKQVRQWLTDQRSFGSDYGPVPGIDPSLVLASQSWGDAGIELDRGLALHLLHHQPIEQLLENREQILANIGLARQAKLRPGDEALVMKAIWLAEASKLASKDGIKPEVIAQAVQNDWESTRDSGFPASPRILDLSTEDRQATQFQQAWPDLAALEGLYLALSHRLDRSPTTTSAQQLKLSQIRHFLAQAVLDGLAEYFTGPNNVDRPTEFTYQKQLWSLAVKAAAARALPESSWEKHVNHESLSTEAILRHRLTIHSVLPESGILEQIQPRLSSSVLHFHEALARLGAKQNSKTTALPHGINYPFPPDFKEIIQISSGTFTVLDRVLRQWVSDSSDEAEDFSESANALYAASLRTFINVSEGRAAERLHSRPKLINTLLHETGLSAERPHFLPPTPGIDGCAGLFAYTTEFFFAISFGFKSECTENLSTDAQIPSPQFLGWKEENTQNPRDGWRVLKAPRLEWTFVEGTVGPFSRLEDPSKITALKRAKDLFEALCRELSQPDERVLIPTARHFLEDRSGKFAILGFPMPKSAVGNLAFVTQKHSGSLIPKTVAAEGASLWRLGVALSDLFQVNDRESAEPGTRFSAIGLDLAENSLPLEIFARHSFGRLRGPRLSMTAEIRIADSSGLPTSIRRALDRIPRFCDAFATGDTTRLFGLLISDLFEEQIRRSNLDLTDAAPTCSEVLIRACRRLLHGADIKFAAELPVAPTAEYFPKRRPARAWMALAERLLLLSSEKDDVAAHIELITTGYRLLAIFENIRAQALERWAALPLERRATGKWSFSLSHWGIGQESFVVDIYNVSSLEDLLIDTTFEPTPRSLQSLDQVTLLGWLGILAALSGLSPENPDRPGLDSDQIPLFQRSADEAELSSSFHELNSTLKDLAQICAQPCRDFSTPESMDLSHLRASFGGPSPKFLRSLFNALDLLDQLGGFRVEEEISNFLAFLPNRASREIRTERYGSKPIPAWAVRQIALAEATEPWEIAGPPEIMNWRATLTLSGMSIVGVGWLTEPFAKLAGVDQERPTYASDVKQINLPDKSTEATEEQKPTQEPKPRKDTSSVYRPIDNLMLKRFEQAQEASWRRRSGSKVPNTARVALFQWNVEPSYRHPLFEACVSSHSGTSADKVIDARRLRSGPLLDSPGKSQTLPSCSEYRRQSVLREVLRACRAFDVDILILPEYSMRPETVDWLVGADAHLGSTSVWAGTYRFVPGYSRSVGLAGRPGDRQDWSSILSVALPHPIQDSRRVLFRHKKYPAVGMNEIFNPELGSLMPIVSQEFQLLPSGVQKMDPRKLVCELICSEVFVMANPSYWLTAASAFAALWQKLNGNPMDRGPLEQILWDAKLMGDYTSYYSSSQFPRRSIILVPAMSTRAVDYTAYGQMGFLASGLTTVFCNAGGIGSEGCGNSCFIGWECWDRSDKKGHPGEPGAGPYHGVEPGIFRQYANGRGWLGKDEQALVIADIDPFNAVEGKPRPQGLLPPLSLVAHLPVIESWNRSIPRENIHESTCCCKSGKPRDLLKEWANFQEFVDLVVPINSGGQKTNEVAPSKGRLLHHLDILAKIAGHKGEDWLCRRRNAYKEFHRANPQPWPPPVAMDWLWVDLKNLDQPLNYPRIEVPPFDGIDSGPFGAESTPASLNGYEDDADDF